MSPPLAVAILASGRQTVNEALLVKETEGDYQTAEGNYGTDNDGYVHAFS